MTIGKTIALIIQTFVGKVISLLFNTLSSFFPRSKCLLILWMQSPSAMILKPKKIKSVNVSIFPPSTCHEEMGPDAMISVFLMFSFQPAFSLSSFTLIKRLFSSSSLSAIRVVSSAYLRLLFLLAILILASDSSSLAFCMMHPVQKLSKQVTVYSLMYCFPNLEPVSLFHIRFCCFLTHTQVSQETSKVV